MPAPAPDVDRPLGADPLAAAERDAALVRPGAIEWPTLALAAAIYGGWLALTWWHAAIPLWLLIPAAAWFVAWHGSLQHEILHGHPTRSRTLNTALGLPPLALWIPYERYRATHLTHHRDERLTDPLDDPESRYLTAADWAALGPVGRAIVGAQSTLAGRLLIGPAWAIGSFWWSEAKAVVAGDRNLARVWAWHLVHAAAVVAWIVMVCEMPLGLYLAAFVYAGTALALLRSFAEHRALPEVPRRTAIVERAPVLGLLFLHNNLHVVHHCWPTLPWYRLPRFYRRHRDAIHAASGGPLYPSYVDVLRRFLWRPHDAVAHPFLHTAVDSRTEPALSSPVDGLRQSGPGALASPSAGKGRG